MSHTSTKKRPTFKQYFKCMLQAKTMSVQLISQEIREIIEEDLGIKLQPPESLYARVCIEAFPYYVTNWPEWKLARKSQYHDELYESLITFLRNKLVHLKKKEAEFIQANLESNIEIETLTLPENVCILEDKKKIEAPYSLQVSVPKKVTNLDVDLRNFGTKDIFMDLNRPTAENFNLEMSFKEFINFPYVYVELNIPGLMRFSRSCPFTIKRYLATQMNDPIPIDSNHILSVENTDENSPHKVYSHEFMSLIFNNLNKCMEHFKKDIGEIKTQISTLCEELLKDIFECNVKNHTICEGSSVTYNIGKFSYYVDDDLSTKNIKNETLVFKKIVTPVSSYNLICCDLTADSLAKDSTLKFFSFMKKKSYIQEMVSIYKIKNCLSFKCVLCDALFTLPKLLEHMKVNHSFQKKLYCMKCNHEFSIENLLSKRWHHECHPK